MCPIKPQSKNFKGYLVQFPVYVRILSNKNASFHGQLRNHHLRPIYKAGNNQE